MTSRSLPADARRAVTIEAVVELAGTKNPSEITTAAIAEQMHLTQGALFRHFPSKDAIWEAVMEWVAEGLLSRLDKAAAGAAGPLEALEAVFMAHIDFVSTHPGVPRMIFGELQRPEASPARKVVRTLVQRYGQRVQALLKEAKAAGSLAPDLDCEAAATLFIGTVQGLVMQSLLAGDAKRMLKDAPRVFAIYRQGIGRK